MELTATKYKQTEVGLIPEDWNVKSLGDIGEVKMCKRIFNYQTKDNGDIPFYKIGTFGKEPDAFISRELYDEFINKYSFPTVGSVLISAAGTIGRLVVFDGTDSYFQDSNIIWIENNNQVISNEYLRHSFPYVRFQTEGGTIKRLYNNILKGGLFPYPPHEEEQKAIAQVLSDTDALIRALEKNIAKKNHIKIGMMQKLLSPKEDWEVKTLGEVGEIITGGTPPTTIKSYWDGKIPWVTPTDIRAEKNIKSSEREITKEGLGVIRKLPPDTLLVTCIASIGKNAILRKAGACNQQINAIVPNDSHNVDFLYYLIENNASYIKGKAGITATLLISKKDFSEITFAFPRNKIEQNQIAKILSDIDLELELLKQKLSKYQLAKQGMMQKLLTGKIRLV